MFKHLYESIPMVPQRVINNHFKVFGYMHKCIPPSRDYDHAIQLQLGNVRPKIKPYKNPCEQKSDIENMFQ